MMAFVFQINITYNESCFSGNGSTSICQQGGIKQIPYFVLFARTAQLLLHLLICLYPNPQVSVLLLFTLPSTEEIRSCVRLSCLLELAHIQEDNQNKLNNKKLTCMSNNLMSCKTCAGQLHCTTFMDALADTMPTLVH